MFSFLSNKKEEELSIVIDIQSGLVRGALVFNKVNENSIILNVVTRDIVKKPHTDNIFLVKKMLKALSEVIESLVEELNKKDPALGYSKKSVKAIHYILSSPWVLSRSKTISMTFEKSTEISEKFVLNLIEEERKKIEEKFNEINVIKDLPEKSDLIFIEQKIFEIKLNGYKVNSYNSKKVDSIDISFAATLSSKKLLKRISSIVNNNLHVRKVQYHSALLLNFMAMRILVPEKDNFVSIHIHNELTDIVVVKKGLAANLSSFPFGTSTLLRRVSSALKESPESTESKLSLYIADKLETIEKENFKKVINPILNKWYQEYLKSVSHPDDDNFLPKTVYMSAHTFLNIFENTITSNNELTKIVSFETDAVTMHVTFEKNFEYNQLLGMYAISLRSMI